MKFSTWFRLNTSRPNVDLPSVMYMALVALRCELKHFRSQVVLICLCAHPNAFKIGAYKETRENGPGDRCSSLHRRGETKQNLAKTTPEYRKNSCRVFSHSASDLASFRWALRFVYASLTFSTRKFPTDFSRLHAHLRPKSQILRVMYSSVPGSRPTIRMFSGFKSLHFK